MWFLNHLTLIVVAFMLIFTIIGGARGLFKQLVSFVSTIVSLIVAALTAKPLFGLIFKNSSAMAKLTDLVGATIAGYVFIAICFIIVFVVCKLLFILFKKFGDALRKITVIRAVDVVLGAILGLCQSLLVIYTVFFIIRLLAEPFSAVDNAIHNSFLLRFFYENNPIRFLLAKIKL